jgi:hypothetical protein
VSSASASGSRRLPDLLDERAVAAAFGLPNERAARRFLRLHRFPVAQLGRRLFITRSALLATLDRMATPAEDKSARVRAVVAKLARGKRELAAVLAGPAPRA